MSLSPLSLLTATAAACAASSWMTPLPQTPAPLIVDELPQFDFSAFNGQGLERRAKQLIGEPEFLRRLQRFERRFFGELARDINCDERHLAREEGLRWKDIPKESKDFIKTQRTKHQTKHKKTSFRCDGQGACYTSKNISERLQDHTLLPKLIFPESMVQYKCVPARDLIWDAEKPIHAWKSPPSLLFGGIVEGILPPNPRADEALFQNTSKVTTWLIDPNSLEILWKVLEPLGLCCRPTDPPKRPSPSIDMCQSTEPVSKICKGNIGWPRSQMPQVEGSVMDLFITHVIQRGLSAGYQVVRATELTATQCEINHPAIRGMLNSTALNTFDPCNSVILVVWDGEKKWVIDGHHRFAVCYILGREMHILIISIQPAEETLVELRHFPFVTTAALNNVLPPGK